MMCNTSYGDMPMRNIILFLIILPFVVSWNLNSAFAYSARTEALQAFSAIAGDITSGKINPATFGGKNRLAGTCKIVKGDDLRYSIAASFLNTRRFTIGGSLDYVRREIGYAEYDYLIISTYHQTAVLQSPEKTIRGGLNINYHLQGFSNSYISSTEERHSYFSFDAGFLIQPNSKLAIGAVINDLFTTVNEKNESNPYGRVGTNFLLSRFPGVEMYAGVDFGFDFIWEEGVSWNKLFASTEVSILRYFALRAGIRYDDLSKLSIDDTGSFKEYELYTLGGGVRLGPLSLDYCYKKYRNYDEIHTVTAQLKLHKPKQKTKQKPVDLFAPSITDQDSEPLRPEYSEELIQSNYKEHFRQGTLASARGDYKTAIQYWKTTLLWNLSSERTIRAQISNAYTNWLSGEFETPEQKQAVEKQQRAWELLKKGYTNYRNGKLESAIYSFEGCLSLDPTLTEAHKWLGCIYAKQGKKEDAADAFRKALSLQADLILTGDVPEEARKIFGTLIIEN